MGLWQLNHATKIYSFLFQFLVLYDKKCIKLNSRTWIRTIACKN